MACTTSTTQLYTPACKQILENYSTPRCYTHTRPRLLWIKLERIASVKSDWSAKTQSSASFARPPPPHASTAGGEGRCTLDWFPWSLNIYLEYSQLSPSTLSMLSNGPGSKPPESLNSNNCGLCIAQTDRQTDRRIQGWSHYCSSCTSTVCSAPAKCYRSHIHHSVWLVEMQLYIHHSVWLVEMHTSQCMASWDAAIQSIAVVEMQLYSLWQ